MKKVLLFFAIMMMAITASARDVVFSGKDTWSKNNSTKTVTCTKDGVTLSLSGDTDTPSFFGAEIEFHCDNATITVDAGTATVTGISVAGMPEFNNFDLTGSGPWTCPTEMGGLKKDDTSMPVNQVTSITVHIQDAPVPTGDVVFSGKDTWSKNNSTKTVTCTKDGVTLSLSGDTDTPSFFGAEIEFHCDNATITVDAGTATVTGISVAGMPEFNNFDLTGSGPWTCPTEMGGLKKDDTSMPVNQVTSITVHIGYTLNSAGYATFSCKDNVNISGAEAYKASVTGETITLTKLTGYIPAGNGVILYSEDPSAIVTLSVPTSGDAAADVSTNNDLKATTNADGSVVATVKSNSWALSSNNTFRKYEGTSYRANRAYLVHEVSSSAATRALSIVNGETGTTGLDNIDSQASAREGNVFENGKIVIIKNGKKYNLAGQEIK